MDDRNNYDQRLGYTNPNYGNPNQMNNQGGYQQPPQGYVGQQQGYPNNYEIDPNYQQNVQNKKYRSEASVRSRFPRWFPSSNNGQETPKKNTQQSNVVIYSPSTYEDVQALIDHLKKGEQVIVDFSTVNQTAVYRILDFMSGAIYALNGSIQQITRNIFLFAPQGVTISVPIQFKRQ